MIAYMYQKKRGSIQPPSQEEIANIRNRYTKDTIFYTEQIEENIIKDNEVSIEA